MRVARQSETLRSERSPDVLVVGGGVIGSLVALRLAKRGISVVVIDRGSPGGEASSAAAGILGPQMEAQGPGPLLDLALASRALYPNLVAELHDATGIDVGFDRSGVLSLALDERGQAELDESVRWQTACGLSVERLSAREARLREPALSVAVKGAVEYPDGAMVDARALTRACVAAAASAGARFMSGRLVRRVLVSDGVARGVELDTERLAAGAVVVAAGSWAGLLEGAALPDAIRPVRGQIVALSAPTSMLTRVVTVHGRGYLVPRRDGTVLAGSTMENVGFGKAVTVDGMVRILSLATVLVGWLGEARVTDSWSGLRPDTPDHLPVLGESASVRGLLLATGHFRSGILLAPITGEAIAQLISTGSSSLDLAPFAVERFARAATG
jgi:glycine oxidase